MNRGHINLEHPERFRGEYKISDEKIQKAIKNATDKLLSKIDIYTDGFPGTYAKDFKYPIGENNSWTCGMHTGTFVLAYELTGDERFLEVAKNHMNSYKKDLMKISILMITMWDLSIHPHALHSTRWQKMNLQRQMHSEPLNISITKAIPKKAVSLFSA